MEAYTNITITMETKEQAVKAAAIMKGLATTKDSEDANIATFIEDITLKGNQIIVEESCSIHSGTFEELPAEIFKALAVITEGDFTAHAWHYSCNCGYQASVDASKRGNEVEITTIIAPNGDGYCPECGEQVVCFDEYDPNETYYCPECGDVLDHKEMFDGDIPTTTKEVITIR